MSFGSRQAVRLGRGLAGGLVLGVLLASPAGAGSYPETALSMALSTPPELVDESSLLFQLPSRAGISRTQLFAFSTSRYYYSSDTNSLGIVGQTHGQAIFVLVQPSFLISAQPAFQVGWGGAWRTLRLGAAARGSMSESESSRYQDGSTTSWNIDETQQEIWEASVGLGFGGDRFELDLAADVQRFDGVANNPGVVTTRSR